MPAAKLAAADEIDSVHDGARGMPCGGDRMRVERGVGIEVAQSARGRRRLDRLDVAAVVNARQLLDRRGRRLVPGEVGLESRRGELVVDRRETIGAFGMIRAHFVLQAGGMRYESGRVHDGNGGRQDEPIGHAMMATERLRMEV